MRKPYLWLINNLRKTTGNIFFVMNISKIKEQAKIKLLEFNWWEVTKLNKKNAFQDTTNIYWGRKNDQKDASQQIQVIRQSLTNILLLPMDLTITIRTY